MSSFLKSVKKRDLTLQGFDPEKITEAIYKAMLQLDGMKERQEAEKVTDLVIPKLENLVARAKLEATEAEAALDEQLQDRIQGILWIEEVQDIVEESIMEAGYHNVAKAYILYREERSKLRKRDIFRKRVNLKPYEYPELYDYVDSIRHSYWLHTEFNFTKDQQDFRVEVDEASRSAIKNAMLAIAQVEVAVKAFWGDIYKHMPKPEIGAVGATFAESEVRHADAYAHLLEILGLNQEFTKIMDIPVFKARVEYLTKSMATAKSEDPREFTLSILLFSLFIENVSLFSQFFIIMSFNKKKALFKGISNAIEATSKEEQIHGLFGMNLINIIKTEHPEWFDEEFKEIILETCREAYEAEKGIIDWIFEKGELNFVPKKTVLEFIKNRLNNSLDGIGMEKPFEIDSELLKTTRWFDEEVIATKHVDFFGKKSVNYNKRSQSITGDDLF